ncbi:MAG: YecA family protein [Rubrivivax sp.]|nr:YecA family protein [Rubrivivax sp.]
MKIPQFDPASPLSPLSPAELDGLDRLLQKLPSDHAMTLDGADGFLTAWLAGPPALLKEGATAEWLPWVWGGDADGDDEEPATFPFASNRQRKDTVVQLLRHLRHIAAQLETPQAWEPIFSIAEKGPDEWADARDWCAGFLQAVDLHPQAWAAAWADPALMELAVPLLGLGGGVEGAPAVPAPAEDDLETVDELSRAVPDAVLALRAFFRR